MNLTEGFRASECGASRCSYTRIAVGELAGRFGATVRPLDPARRLTALPANSGALIHHVKTHLPRDIGDS
jgi:hypothetical protein